MCGICGFTGPPDKETLKKMAHRLRHRGPDDDGFYVDARVSLGMRRLSIVDLEGGRQPISSEDGKIQVISNGEIYNHAGLRKRLEAKGHRFVSDHCDTEVIVHLYEEYGEDWPLQVNGMFGTALWDQERESLLLFRDRIGKKPLYYAEIRGQIVFGSEIKSLLAHPLVSREPNFSALYHYFGTKNLSAPVTAYSSIKQLLPGHVLVWRKGQASTRPYWKVDFSDPLGDITEEEAAGEILALLEDSVRLRMDCDVPYGAYLSGGVDSSSVVVLMNRMQSRPVKTFCLGYADEPEGQFAGKAEDMAYARRMSKRLGTEHYEFIIDANQFRECMPEVLAAFDEPFSGTISTFFLSILIKRHVKVALSGDGADELFGSYLAHRLAFPIENYMILKQRGKEDWSDLKEEDLALLHPFDTPEQFLFLKRVASRSLAGWRGNLEVFTPRERSLLLKKDFLDAAGEMQGLGPNQKPESSLTGRDALNRCLEMDQKELLPNQVLPFVDRLSMAHSIEVRCPYLDYRIIELANRLPGTFKIKNGVVKYIHKKAMENLVPQDLLQRQKEGFVQPIYSWMHGRLKSWVEKCIMAVPTSLFNMDYVKTLVQAFKEGNQSINAKVWNLVCFGIWCEQMKAEGRAVF